MTIRKRLWVSQIISFIIPLLLTLLVTLTTVSGLFYYISEGNYIYVEGLVQHNRIYDVINYVTYRDLQLYAAKEKANKITEKGIVEFKGRGNLEHADRLFRLFDPTLIYVIISEDRIPIYEYGNEALASNLPREPVGSKKDGISKTSEYIYATRTNYAINNHIYTFGLVHERPMAVDDQKLDRVLIAISASLILLLMAFIWFVSRFLNRFTMRRIVVPLKALAQASQELEQGNLNVHIDDVGDDEFRPIISQFNAMAESLRSNAAQKAKEEQSRRELIAGISHDLRTPLTSIKAYVEGLQDNIAPTPEMQEKYIKIIGAKVDTLDSLLDELFLFSKLDLGQSALRTEPIRLDFFLRTYVEENKDLYASRGLTVALTIHKGALILGDTSLLLRSIENLLTNSVKYKSKPMGHSRITLSTAANNAVITVTDDGPGVPTEELSKLFGVFYRTDKARKTKEGSGLGLAITAKYISLMGGTIEASNAKPQGLQITITIPLYHSQS